MSHNMLGKRRHVGPGASTVRRPGSFTAPATKTVKREGVQRRPRERKAAELPISERHQAILELVGTEPTSPARIARTAGVAYSSAQSALYVLADRGLIERVPYKGWRRV